MLKRAWASVLTVLQQARAAILAVLLSIDGWAARWAPRWDKLRTVSNNPVGRAVIIVPLVGYWILLNDWVVRNVLPLANALVGDMPSHTPWQLYATFFGLWLVGVGSGIYLMFCPPDIKRYATSSEYTGALASTISPIELKRVTAALNEGDEQTQEEVRELGQERFGQHYQEPDADYDARWRLDRWSNLLKLYFDLCNRRYATARLTATVLYIVGFAALGLPSLSLFLRVVGVAIRTLTP